MEKPVGKLADEGAEGTTAPSKPPADQLEALKQVTEATLAHMDLDDLLEELLGRVTGILGTDTAAVLLVEDDGKTLAARAARGLEEEVERGFRLPIGEGFAGRVAATREPVAIPDLEDSEIEVVNPLMREKGVRSLLGVPLIVEGRLTGVLHVGTLSPREWSDSDVDLLQAVADRVGLAIDHARMAAQHRISKTLQRSLLPTSLPSLPGLALAARYMPAASDTDVGGDWYDVIELGHEKVGLAIGDVAGRGLMAATFMGQLRSAVRAYAVDGGDPATVLSKLAHFVEVQGGTMATVLYATLDLATLELAFARAGHPYPLIIRGDGTTTFLTADGGPPIGSSARVIFEESRASLRPGDTLLLYTDGLIERRGQRLSDGEARLAAAAAAAPGGIQAKCTEIIDRMTEGDEFNDDIAVLGVQAVGLSAALDVVIPAKPRELAGVRHLLRRWLFDHGAGDDDCSAFAIAVTEACANAIEHAYGPGEAAVQIRASMAGEVVTVTVADYGNWRDPRGSDGNRRRGITLMGQFMDDVQFAKLDEGTTVQLRRRLRGSE
jgi:serine phosphatase RsbU (regulator of sigma subunit)/anti-sigma regulatory factor (Ser/Thr protein kinase)